MKTDALDRRKRTYVQPTGKNLKINAGVLSLIEGLRRYHPLPPQIAFRLWNAGTYYPRFQDRLTDLTNEMTGGGDPLLWRTEYFNPKGVLNSEPVWYELSPRGLRMAQSLAEHPLTIPERDHIKHRAFNACVGASFEIFAPLHGMRSIHFEDIIAHPRCPSSTRALSNPLMIPLPHGKHVEADRIHGFEHIGEGFWFYAIEIDRATESNVRTVYEKLDNWLYVLQHRLYRSFLRTAEPPHPVHHHGTEPHQQLSGLSRGQAVRGPVLFHRPSRVRR